MENKLDREQIIGSIAIRKIVSLDKPPIQSVIDGNVLPNLLKFIQNENEPHLQLEAAWIFVNIASGTTYQAKTIKDINAFSSIVNLLKNKYMQICEQAIWLIANLSAESVLFRNFLLEENSLEYIAYSEKKSEIVKTCYWAMSNLVRGKPVAPYKYIKCSIECFVYGLLNENDETTLIDIMWAISYLSDGDNDECEIMVRLGIIPRISSLLHITIGNIAAMNNDYITMFINQEVVEKLILLLQKTEHKRHQIEICWALSNFTAGESFQINYIVSCQEVVERIITIINTKPLDIAKEALMILCNACLNGNPQDVYQIVEYGFMKSLVVFLDISIPGDIVKTALEVFSRIIEYGETNFKINNTNIMMQQFINLDGPNKIESLQLHKDATVYNTVTEFIKKNFQVEDPLLQYC